MNYRGFFIILNIQNVNIVEIIVAIKMFYGDINNMLTDKMTTTATTEARRTVYCQLIKSQNITFNDAWEVTEVTGQIESLYNDR